MKKNRHKKESLLNKRVLVKWIDSNLSERTWVDLEDYETDISEIESYYLSSKSIKIEKCV